MRWTEATAELCTEAGEALLKVSNLRKHFPVKKGLLLARTIGWVKAVDGVSFDILPGETLALVGETGCGKTTTTRVLLRLERPTAGSIMFRNKDIQRFSAQEVKQYRRSVQAVFQDPWSSLNPRMRVGSAIAEPLVVNESPPKAVVRERIASLLVEVGLHPEHADMYPHELSGGQRQRVAVARSLAIRPDLIILDEPVSALDVSIRAQIMNLLKDLQAEYGLSYLLIAHHLGTVRYMATWVAVMYLGKIVELAAGEELFSHPLHPYTKALLLAALPSHPRLQREGIALKGEVASPLNPPPGCSFHPRCPSAGPACPQFPMVLKEVGPHHWVSCVLHQ